MKEILLSIDTIINEYQKSTNHHPQGIIDMMINLSANLYSLESYRTMYHQVFEERVHKLKNEGWKVNAAQNEASVEIPQLYELRRKMERADNVLQVMRSQLSLLKAEMQTNLHDA